MHEEWPSDAREESKVGTKQQDLVWKHVLPSGLSCPPLCAREVFVATGARIRASLPQQPASSLQKVAPAICASGGCLVFGSEVGTRMKHALTPAG